nr:phosphoribosyltransferase family protein [Yinghuangia soli]
MSTQNVTVRSAVAGIRAVAVSGGVFATPAQVAALTAADAAGEWPGSWVARRLGLRMEAAADSVGPRFSMDVLAEAADAARLRALVGLALRRNPRRAHLLVSTVLGKHVPQLPHVVHDAGRALGALVRGVLEDEDGCSGTAGLLDTGRPPKVSAFVEYGAAPVVLGYAETATGLGHCVAESLPGATYLHSTRRPVDGVAPLGGFEEEHSHATSHLLLPEDPDWLTGGAPLVLVDDELSTGRTVLNTIEALHRVAPRTRYVIASLIDVRRPGDRRDMEAFAARLGVRVDVVALAGGVVELPDDALRRGAELVAAEEARRTTAVPSAPTGAGTGTGVPSAGAGEIVRLALAWPPGLPDGGRHGFTAWHQSLLDAALPRLGSELAGQLAGARRVLVLGFEELMYAPLRLARALADAFAEADPGSGTGTGADAGVEVRYSTTTRSPVLAVDDPGYAIRTRLAFPAHDDPADGPGERYAYNVDPGTDHARRFDTIVLVVDDVADTPALHAPGGLLDALSRVSDRTALAVLPGYVPASARTPRPEAAV